MDTTVVENSLHRTVPFGMENHYFDTRQIPMNMYNCHYTHA